MSYPATRKLKGLKTLSERISWLVNDVVRRNKLSNSKLAAIMSVGKRTITNYRGMHMTPDMLFIKNMGELFGANVVWVHTGKGEPYNDFDAPGPTAGDDKMGDKASTGASPRSIATSPRKAKPVDASGAGRVARKADETGRRTPELEQIHAHAFLLNIEDIDQSDTVRNMERKIMKELARLRNKVNKLKSQLENPR